MRSVEKIPKGGHISTWGGRIFKEMEDEEDWERSIEIHEHLSQGQMYRNLSEADGFNHSCNPNLGIRGGITLVAMRDIEAG